MIAEWVSEFLILGFPVVAAGIAILLSMRANRIADANVDEQSKIRKNADDALEIAKKTEKRQEVEAEARAKELNRSMKTLQLKLTSSLQGLMKEFPDNSSACDSNSFLRGFEELKDLASSTSPCPADIHTRLRTAFAVDVRKGVRGDGLAKSSSLHKLASDALDEVNVAFEEYWGR
jgi:hypothetical protein